MAEKQPASRHSRKFFCWPRIARVRASPTALPGHRLPGSRLPCCLGCSRPKRQYADNPACWQDPVPVLHANSNHSSECFRWSHIAQVGAPTSVLATSKGRERLPGFPLQRASCSAHGLNHSMTCPRTGRTLHLYHSRIQSIQENAFVGLTSLTYVPVPPRLPTSRIPSAAKAAHDLKYSMLTCPCAGRDLQLHGNQISSIPLNAFNGLTSLTYVPAPRPFRAIASPNPDSCVLPGLLTASSTAD